jgi:hypothetical protein
MDTTREVLQAVGPGTLPSITPRHPRERTGVRFVLTNAADPSRADDYRAWYDDYESAIIRPGLLATHCGSRTRAQLGLRATHNTQRFTTS